MKSRKAKVLHRAGGAYLLEHVLEAVGAVVQPARISVVVGYQSESVKRAVSHYGVHFQLQKNQLGTGDAVLSCRDLPQHQDGRVIVVYGDSPLLRGETIRSLYFRHVEEGCPATLITTFLDDPTGYGRILRDEDGHVEQIVEEKACGPDQKRLKEVNPGIYCFETGELWKHLEKLEPNPASGEYYLTDIVELFRASGLTIAAHPVEDPREIMGINTRVELAEVDRILRQRAAQTLMLNGVTIEKPETVTIDKGVRVGMDTVIGPFAQLLGKTQVGENCAIGACSILKDAVLGDEIAVHAFSVVEESRLERGAHVGPFARLRMNAHVEADARVGNFVELKKTRLGKGAKSMHLAYLGDAAIGAESNIGAGTITCNYDGRKKQLTTIGEGAFIGSNSTLVAPVEIGAGSYVGAGSVITKDVPPDSLAIGRAHQAPAKEGWAKRRREQQE